MFTEALHGVTGQC